jgi:hypothetical protein
VQPRSVSTLRQNSCVSTRLMDVFMTATDMSNTYKLYFIVRSEVFRQ